MDPMDMSELWWNIRQCMGAVANRTKAQNAEFIDYPTAYEYAGELLTRAENGEPTPWDFDRTTVLSYCRSVVERTRPYAEAAQS